MVILGLLLGLVGTDGNTGGTRFTFGIRDARRRHRLRAARDRRVRHRRDHRQPARGRRSSASLVQQKITRLWPTREDFRLRLAGGAARHRRSARCSACCRAAARRSARSPPMRWRRNSRSDPSRFGKGAIEGVAGPESANNAGAQTSFIPMLTLGIPGNAVMALMIGALTIHGIQPGPQVMTERPDAVLGHDRQHVDRQPDAGRHQPAADRHVGAAAARCRTGCSISRSCCSARSASTR